MTKIKDVFEEIFLGINLSTCSKVGEMQEVYTDLLSKENVKEYFDAEFKFNVLLADVNKIIGEAVRDVLE